MPIEFQLNSGRESRTWLYATVIGGIIAVVALARLMLPSILSPKSATAALHKPSEGQEQVETVPASSAPAQIAAPTINDEQAAISSLLDQFRDAAQRRDFAAIGNLFDAHRFYDELNKLVIADSLSDSQKQDLLDHLRAQVPPMFADAAPLDWSGHRLTKFSFSEDGQEAVVYDVETGDQSPRQRPSIARWWVRKTGSQWKLWDLELLGQWMRITTAAAAQLPASDIARSTWRDVQNSFPHFRAVYSAINSRDMARCDSEQKILDAVSLPPQLAALRATFQAEEHISRSEFDDALKNCGAAEQTGEDAPYVHVLRSLIYDKLGQYDNAYQSETKWESELGGNSDLHYAMGIALERLNHIGDAAAALGKSLDEDPNSTTKFIELCKLSPTMGKGEITRRLSLFENPAGAFAFAMPALQQSHDLDGMLALLDAYRARRESFSDPLQVYFTAETLILRSQYKQAEGLLGRVLPLSLQAGREIFAEEYYRAASLAGDGLQDYAEAADASGAFRDLARAFYSSRDFEDLEKLVSAHLSRFPKDPWAIYYRAKLFENVGDFDDADSAYRLAMSFGDSRDDITFRIDWVHERATSGRGLSAYDDIQPGEIVFPQLARALTARGDRSDLARLVSKRRSDAQDDPNLPLWEAESKFMAGKYADAARILETRRDTIQLEKFNIPRYRDLYIRSEIRLGHFDTARGQVASFLSNQTDWLHIAMIECTAGNTAGGIEALNAMLQKEGDSILDRLYRDPDLGPVLASPAFASWRQAHPNSPANKMADSLD